MKIALIVALALLASVGGCIKSCYRNVNATKAAAAVTWHQAGFEIVGYEGYQGEIFHGGKVWYIVRRVPDNGILYHGWIGKWGSEYHIYTLQAIDAIKPKTVN